MIDYPYKDISEEITVVLNSLISSEDKYHQAHRRRMARTLQIILNEKPTGTLLEIGTSHLIPLALEKLLPELSVYVTDFNLQKEPLGEMEVSLNEHSRTVPCARVNIENTPLPFNDETFDYVICSEVVEHMEVDPMYMIAQINRVLKTEGKLLVTTPNAVSTWSITKMLRGIEPYFYMQYRHGASLYRHNYEYSIHSLSYVMKAAGFEGNAWTEDTFEEPNYIDIDKLKSIGYDLQHLGDNIFTFSTKKSDVVERYPKVIYAD